MMKRCLGLILSALLVFSSIAVVSAAETVETTVDINVNTVTVTVKTTIDSGLTIKVYPATKNETLGQFEITDKTAQPIHFWQERKPIEEIEDSLFKYKFDPFNFSSLINTGDYIVVVNNTHEKHFHYVKKADKVDVYNKIAVATSSDQIKDIIKTAYDEGKIEFDLGNYLNYDDSVPVEAKAKTNISQYIVDLPLIAIGDNPDDPTLSEFETELKSAMAYALKVAEIVVASDATTFDAKVKANKDDLGLYLEYYSNSNFALNPQDVQSNFNSIPLASYASDDVNKAFNSAVLLSLVASELADYSVITEALNYYNALNNDKGKCITLDKSYCTNFVEDHYNQVSAKIKADKANIDSISKLENAFLTYSKEVKESLGGASGLAPSPGPAPSPGSGPAPGGLVNPSVGGDKTEIKPVTFSDLGQATWAEESIKAMAEKGILEGKGDGKFYPNETVTREQFVKIIVEAFDLFDASATADFADVQTERWSYGHIASAYNAGVITGVGGASFNAGGTMTRQDMAVIIYRVAEMAGLSYKGSSAVFTDNSSIAGYAKEAVGALYNAGIINGTGNNRYSPLDAVTRAQAAKIVYELLNVTGGAK